MSEKENDKEPSFKVRDKRSSFNEDEKSTVPEESKESSEEEIKEEAKEKNSVKEKISENKNTEESSEKKTEPQEIPPPEINFATFILSMSTSTMFHLGDFPNPETKKTEKNLPLAKQSIDIIEMLKEKTKGNLNSEEEKLIDNILYDLHMRYVKASGS